MWSSSAASQPTYATRNFVHLPLNVWTDILKLLDIVSLSVMVEAAPELKFLAFSRSVLRSVTINAATDKEAIVNILQSRGEQVDPDGMHHMQPLVEHVRELHFTNCAALFSHAIIGIAKCCYSLRELYIVHCVVEPTALLGLLSQTLRCVTKLEWSLHDEFHYDTLSDDTLLEACAISESNRPNIEVMYVEVFLTYSTQFLVGLFVSRCHRLRHLQVHGVGLNRCYDGSLAVDEFRRVLPFMQTFKYSCEQRTYATLETRLDVMKANISWKLKPKPSFNVLSLADVVDQKLHVRVRQAILVLEVNWRAESLLKKAASQPQFWENITHLTLALTAPKRTELPTPPIVPCIYADTLRQFFMMCFPRISELNLCSSHFNAEPNCCVLLAGTLPMLRSLALTPCGANHVYSLEFLAECCRLLEDLTIRSNPFGGVIPSCEACEMPLCFTRSSFRLFQRKTRLRRLSIDEEAKVQDLAFLMECRVERLRLGVDRVGDGELEECPSQLGELLAANPYLTSLTLTASRATLSYSVAETFTKIRSLRHLAVLTTSYATHGVVEDFFWYMESSLPRLLSVHVHYDIGSSDLVQANTWVRDWGPEYGDATPVGMRRTAKGEILCDGSCVGRLCCVETFIGLVGPRNRP
ncbi:hypothetical protein MRX96_011168 [Rhipicephalus microplus]